MHLLDDGIDSCEALVSQWHMVHKCIGDYIAHFVDKIEQQDKLETTLIRIKSSMTNHNGMMEWLTGLITPATFDTFKSIFITNSLTNNFILDLINISQLAFKYIVWSHRIII